MSRPEQRQFKCRIVFQIVEFLRFNRLVVLRKEHRFAFTKGAGGRK